MRSVKKIVVSLFIILLISVLAVSCTKKNDDTVIEIRAEKVDEVVPVTEVPEEVVPVVEVEEPVEAVPEETAEKEPVEEEPVVEDNADEASDSVEEDSVGGFFYVYGDDIPVVEEETTEEPVVEEEPEEVVEEEPVVYDLIENEDNSDADFFAEDYSVEALEVEIPEEPAEEEPVVEEEPVIEEEPEIIEIEEEPIVEEAVEEVVEEEPLFSLFASDVAEPKIVEEEPVVEEVTEEPVVEEVVAEEPVFTDEELKVVELKEQLVKKNDEKRRLGVQFGFGAQYTKLNYVSYCGNVMKYTAPVSLNLPMGKAITVGLYVKPAYIYPMDQEKGKKELPESFSFAGGLGVGIMTNGIFEIRFDLGVEYFNKGTSIVENPCGLLNVCVLPSIKFGPSNLWLSVPIESSFSFEGNYNSAFAGGLYLTYRTGEPK